ncbi:uncharacterized protein LOC143230540 [Tachypleus tridentatus]|uniref:uncharacterized protein LOC143230540 n=1 Tax=Tachypleus tridentatus TaxID=6853 RepID=UPI003FCFDAA6
MRTTTAFLLAGVVLLAFLADTINSKKHQHEEGKHNRWEHKHHGKKDHHHHKIKGHEGKVSNKYVGMEYKTDNTFFHDFEKEKRNDEKNKMEEPNLEQGKQQQGFSMQKKRKTVRHEAGHQEKAQYEKKYWKGMKNNKTPKDIVKEKEEQVKPPKKTKEATTKPEKVTKKTKYQPEGEEKKSEKEDPVAVPGIQEGGGKKVEPIEATKETVWKENEDPTKIQVEPVGETKNTEKKKPVGTCTSSTDCQPGFCCQSKKGKQLTCNKVQLGLGQRCQESCMCKEGLVCHFEQSSAKKEKPGKNDKAPLGVCKPPEVVGIP